MTDIERKIIAAQGYVELGLYEEDHWTLRARMAARARVEPHEVRLVEELSPPRLIHVRACYGAE